MNSLLLFIVGILLEIFLIIKVGQNIGAINTILLIFFTAIVGIYTQDRGIKYYNRVLPISIGIRHHYMKLFELLLLLPHAYLFFQDLYRRNWIYTLILLQGNT